MIGSDPAREPSKATLGRAHRVMRRFGFEITAIVPEPEFAGWQVHWRVKNGDFTTTEYGARGDTASAAVRAAVQNAIGEGLDIRGSLL
jgi:hypothetical protein